LILSVSIVGASISGSKVTTNVTKVDDFDSTGVAKRSSRRKERGTKVVKNSRKVL
jgi:hypothetical protein